MSGIQPPTTGFVPSGISSFADECFSAAGKAASVAPSPANPPPYLFKYVSAQTALYTIRTGRVYFAHRSQFNDPVDGQVFINTATEENRGKIIDRHYKIFQMEERLEGSTVPPLPAEERLKYARKLESSHFAGEIENCISDDYDRLNIGVFCMARSEYSFSMWAHYGDSHRGCCLVFSTKSFSAAASDWEKKFPFVFVGEVKYNKKYPTFPGAESFAPHQEGSVYMTKSEDWGYEKEWRAIAYDAGAKLTLGGKSTFQEAFAGFPGLAKKMTGPGEYVLPDKRMLAAVVLGDKMSDSDKKSVMSAAMSHRLVIAQAVTIQRKIRIMRIYPRPRSSGG